MKIGEKIISNATYLFLGWFTTVVLSFVFWFSLGKTLVKEELGIVSTIINFIALLTLFSLLGITFALQKLIPEFKRKNSKKLYALIRISAKPIFITLAIVLLILFIFSNHLSSILKVSRESIFICTFSLSIIVPFSFFGSILYGFQNMKKFFITDLFQIIIRILISLLLIFLGFRFYGPLIAFGFGYLIPLFFRIDLKYFKNNNSYFSYKKLFYYASPAFILTITSSIITNSQYIILTILKNPGVTGIFTIAFLLTSFIGVMFNVLSSAMFPIISGLSVDRKMKSREGYLIALVLRYSLTVIIPISVILLIFSKWFVLSFSSIEYISASTYFPILIPGAMLFGIGGIFNSNIYAIGKPKISRNILVATTLLFLTISILAVQYFSVMGLLFAYLGSMLFYFTLNLIYIRKFLTINFFISDIFKMLLSSTIIGLVILFIYPMISNIIIVAIISISSIVLYLILLLPMKFYRGEDIRILEFFAKVIPTFNKLLSMIIDFLKKFRNK